MSERQLKILRSGPQIVGELSFDGSLSGDILGLKRFEAGDGRLRFLHGGGIIVALDRLLHVNLILGVWCGVFFVLFLSPDGQLNARIPGRKVRFVAARGGHFDR